MTHEFPYSIEELVQGATWESTPRWPHLEFAWKQREGEHVIRWPEGTKNAGWPMWRCVRCKGYINRDGSQPNNWDKSSPCANETCKAYFYLRWPGGL